MKKLFVVLSVILVAAACSDSEEAGQPTHSNPAPTIATTPAPTMEPALETAVPGTANPGSAVQQPGTGGSGIAQGSPSPQPAASDESDDFTVLVDQDGDYPGLAEMNLDEIPVEGVDEELLQVMMTFLEAVKEQDSEKAEALYHPQAFEAHMSYYFEFDIRDRHLTRIYANPRGPYVAAEFGFKREEGAMVTIDFVSQGNSGIYRRGDMNFIFLKDTGEWLMFKKD